MNNANAPFFPTRRNNGGSGDEKWIRSTSLHEEEKKKKHFGGIWQTLPPKSITNGTKIHNDVSQAGEEELPILLVKIYGVGISITDR